MVDHSRRARVPRTGGLLGLAGTITLIEPGRSMETVQFECGTCHRVMAVSLEHLGAQVHCPHCQTIVQAPPAGTPSSSLKDGGDIGREGESIFAGPAPTDDIFNSPPSGPKIEMPVANESPTLADYSADAPLPRIPLMFSREPQEDNLSASDASKNTGRSAETPTTWSDSAGLSGDRDPNLTSLGAAAFAPPSQERPRPTCPDLLGSLRDHRHRGNRLSNS